MLLSTFPNTLKCAEITPAHKYLSPYLCGFRKGYNTQDCLLIMLEQWRKSLDKKEKAGAILTDLSKAFDSLNHDLLLQNWTPMVSVRTL